MNTHNTSTSKKGLVLSVTIYVVFMTVLILVLGTPSFGQTTTGNEPCVAFRYDGFENPDYAPATVPTVEQLEENIIDRKMEKYDAKGLPSMEDVKKNMIDIVIGKIILPKMPELGSIEENVSSLLTHLMRDDTKNTAHLMKEDMGYSLYLAHLVNPDWDGAHCA